MRDMCVQLSGDSSSRQRLTADLTACRTGKGFASGGTDRRLLQWEAVFSPLAPRPRSPDAAAPQQAAAEEAQEVRHLPPQLLLLH